MASSYYDQNRAQANLGRALAERGWTLYGWKDDRSDVMTDYFDPESWDGVAVRGECVACIGVSSARMSGRCEARMVRIPQGRCERCGGSGDDPSGWTLEAARKSPARYHAETARPGTVALMPHVVSPVPFRDDAEGRLRCQRCGGEGELFRSERREDGPRWPTFQANPPRCNWHVERSGRILAQGSGAWQCASANEHMDPWRTRVRAKLERIVGKIEAATRDRPNTPRGRGGDGVADPESAEVRPSPVREGYVEVAFPAKPPAETRSLLKAAGFRWAKRSGCWYGPSERLPEPFRGAA